MKLPSDIPRVCGGCTACCTAIPVGELNKPAFTSCSNECAAGCAIYPTRPPECRRFACLWLQGMRVPGVDVAELRPDRSGLVVWMQAGTSLGPVITISEAWPDALKSDTAAALLKHLGGALVLLVGEEMCELCGPRNLVEAAFKKLK